MIVPVGANELKEDSRKKCKDECLNQTHEQFHEVERQGWQEGEILGHQRHETTECLLTTVDITKQTEAECNRADRNGDDLKDTHQEEDDHHTYEHASFEVALRSKNVTEEVFNPVFSHRPIKPEDRKSKRHRSRHVQIRIAATQQALNVPLTVNVSDGPNPRNQRKIVNDQDQQERAAKNQKVRLTR